MMQLAIFFAFALIYALSAVSSAQTISCGASQQATGFIVNGSLAGDGKWPWIASIHKARNDQLICGGVLVAQNMVLTAAHCIQGKQKATPRSPVEIIVKLGKYDLSVKNERGSEIKYVDEIIVHPKWDPQSSDFDGDIAVLLLDTKVVVTYRIAPICLWVEKEKPKALRGTVVGWGKSEFENAHEDKPREIDLVFWNNADCFLNSSRFTTISSANTFCAGKAGGQGGACYGDSGSGMFIPDATNRWFLKGLVSSGFVNRDDQCDVTEFSLFTDVLKYTDWIYQTARDNNILLPMQPKGEQQETKKEIFCFFESWAWRRPGNGKFAISDLKPELCTHLVYLHAMTEGESLKAINDDENGFYQAFNNLKKKNRQLKTLLCVGSWNEGSVKYSQLAADPARRKRFALNSAAFIKKNGFNGMHFHWEYPANRGGAREDKENFPLLLRDIKEVFDRENLYLTAMVKTWHDIVRGAYDLRSVAQHVDKVLMVTFDMAGRWDNKVGYAAPLDGAGQINVKKRVDFFTVEGVPASKMVIGIPFYGRTFISENEGDIGMPSEWSFAGPFYKEIGFLGYNEFCHMQKEQKFETRYDVRASQGLSKFVKDGKTHVVTYDTPRTVANKMKFVVDKKLAGAWVWFVSGDDLHGECEPDATRFADYPPDLLPTQTSTPRDFPLLRTINEALEILLPGIHGKKAENFEPAIEDRIVFNDKK